MNRRTLLIGAPALGLVAFGGGASILNRQRQAEAAGHVEPVLAAFHGGDQDASPTRPDLGSRQALDELAEIVARVRLGALARPQPEGAVVESMDIVDGKGPRGRDEVTLPGAMAAQLRRVSAAQELTVEAAITGDRDTVFEAMLLDPLAGRIDYDALGRMTDEMLAATKPWLPQFA